MKPQVLNAITGRLSLRPPQAESLSRLAKALEFAPEMLEHDKDLTAVLASLKSLFPTLEDFEREFPSLCFALATGVGKTRLMGAISSIFPSLLPICTWRTASTISLYLPPT